MPSDTIITISPATNQPILTRNETSASELERIPQQAQEAFRSFSQTSLKQRQDIVTKALGILENKKDVLASEITEQMGRPISYTPVEVGTAIKRSHYLNRISEDILGEKGTVNGEPEVGFRRYIKRKPVGVVLILFAWNVSLSGNQLPIEQTIDVCY